MYPLMQVNQNTKVSFDLHNVSLLLKNSLINNTCKLLIFSAEIVEPKNIQIIFQDLPEVQDIQNITMIDASNIGNVINLQDKIQWEEVFTIPAENQVTIQYHVNENFS